MSGITWPAPVSSVGGTHPWLCGYRVAGLHLFPLAVGGRNAACTRLRSGLVVSSELSYRVWLNAVPSRPPPSPYPGDRLLTLPSSRLLGAFPVPGAWGLRVVAGDTSPNPPTHSGGLKTHPDPRAGCPVLGGRATARPAAGDVLEPWHPLASSPDGVCCPSLSSLPGHPRSSSLHPLGPSAGKAVALALPGPQVPSGKGGTSLFIVCAQDSRVWPLVPKDPSVSGVMIIPASCRG